MTRSPRLLLASAAIAAALAVAPASTLAASTLHAAPFGENSACSEKEPCTIYKAVEKAEDGDSVLLAPGTYKLVSGLTIDRKISLGGSDGAAASTTLEALNSVSASAEGATLHDLTTTGKYGLAAYGDLVERVYVSYSGNSSSACAFRGGTVVRDSVCWAHDGSTSGAIEAESNFVKGTIVLENVTVVDADPSATAIYAEAFGAGGELTVNATNVIAVGTGHPDIEAINSGGGASTTVNLTHSDYAKMEDNPPAEVITAPGTNGNVTAAPAFVNASIGDFHELATSPTVGAGLVGPATGAFDLGGAPRTLTTCDGTVVIDIGAYQLGQSTPCPPENHFELGKLKLNKKKGTATLVATIPGAGAVKLTGKGLKVVTKNATGGGSVKLAIGTVGKAKKGLVKRGTRKVAAKVTFTPTGGSPFSLTRKLTLHRKLPKPGA